MLEAALAEVGFTGGVRLRLETEVIPGAGLGGSGAAAVAALAALDGSRGAAIARDDLARRALRLEQDRLRLHLRAARLLFAAFGGLVDLRFDAAGAMTQAAALGDATLTAALGAGLLLVDTGQRRVPARCWARAAQRRGDRGAGTPPRATWRAASPRGRCRR